MRLHVLLFTFLVLRTRAASLPDKTDIEKKLTNVVKEVLEKDQVPAENAFSDQELIDQANEVKEIENNLRKSADLAAIPVKVIVEDVVPELKTEPENKENNEIVPESEESAEIKRVEIDLKNPGPPQRMQHDTQNPEHFEDSQQAVVQKAQTLNSWWKSTPQYNILQKDLQTLKENFNKKIDELNDSIQKVWSDVEETEKEDASVHLRASLKQDASTEAPSPGFGNPFQGGGNPFAQMIQNWQSSLSNFNKTVNEYFANQTTQFQGSNNTNINGGTNWFNFGNFGGQPDGAQSDESRPPGLWQNIQNFFSGGNNQPPASAQADSPQPAKPERPVLQAIQNAFQNGINYFQPNNNNNKPVEVPQQPEPEKPVQEGGNAVPTEVKPENEKEKQKPEAPQQVTQSSPIKQMIGNNPIIQGLAGAVQRIQHTINPEKPREEEVKNVEHKEPATKGHKPSGANTGDNHDGSRVEANVPVVQGQDEPPKEVLKEEEPTPVTQDKTE